MGTRRNRRTTAGSLCLLLALSAAPALSPSLASATPGFGGSINHALCANGNNYVLEHDDLLPAEVCFDEVAGVLVVQNVAPYWVEFRATPSGRVVPNGMYFPSDAPTTATVADIALAQFLGQSIIPPGGRYTFRIADLSSAINISILPQLNMMRMSVAIDLVTSILNLPDPVQNRVAAYKLLNWATGRGSWTDFLDALPLEEAAKAVALNALKAKAATTIIDLAQLALKQFEWKWALDRYTGGLLIVNNPLAFTSNKVVRLANGTAYYVDVYLVRHWIPDGRTFNCLVGWKGKGLIGISQARVDALAAGANQTCTATEAAGKVIRKSDGTAYYVDASVVRHWIPDGRTFNCLVGWKSKPLVNNVSATQVGAFVVGANQTCTATEAAGKVIRKSDGTAYYVDAGVVRHWIPDGRIYNCLIGWKSKPLVNNVSATQVGAFVVGANQTCTATEAAGKVIRKSDGTAYYVDANAVRHWIPNGGTYNCLRSLRGKPLINNVSETQVASFVGGANQVCKALLVGPDGTSFYVGSSGKRQWVPTQRIFVCLENSGVPVYRFGTWTTINLFAQDSKWAAC